MGVPSSTECTSARRINRSPSRTAPDRFQSGRGRTGRHRGRVMRIGGDEGERGEGGVAAGPPSVSPSLCGRAGSLRFIGSVRERWPPAGGVATCRRADACSSQRRLCTWSRSAPWLRQRRRRCRTTSGDHASPGRVSGRERRTRRRSSSGKRLSRHSSSSQLGGTPPPPIFRSSVSERPIFDRPWGMCDRQLGTGARGRRGARRVRRVRHQQVCTGGSVAARRPRETEGGDDERPTFRARAQNYASSRTGAWAGSAYFFGLVARRKKMRKDRRTAVDAARCFICRVPCGGGWTANRVLVSYRRLDPLGGPGGISPLAARADPSVHRR
jgi:hypothetical protein